MSLDMMSLHSVVLCNTSSDLAPLSCCFTELPRRLEFIFGFVRIYILKCTTKKIGIVLVNLIPMKSLVLPTSIVYSLRQHPLIISPLEFPFPVRHQV